jgi:hypothetical protein
MPPGKIATARLIAELAGLTQADACSLCYACFIVATAQIGVLGWQRLF